MPRPVLYLHLEPKVLPARAELVPRCRKVPAPPAARPAGCRGSCSGSSSPTGDWRGSGRPPHTRSVHVLLQNRQTPSPTPPRLFIFNHLDRSSELKGKRAQA